MKRFSFGDFFFGVALYTFTERWKYKKLSKMCQERTVWGDMVTRQVIFI